MGRKRYTGTCTKKAGMAVLVPAKDDGWGRQEHPEIIRSGPPGASHHPKRHEVKPGRTKRRNGEVPGDPGKLPQCPLRLAV
jgi:hypothetical protein